jgi:uncharacterized membrane protein YccC
LVEILALVLLRLPTSLRYQRSRLAATFDALAQLATQHPSGSATSALSSLDDTERVLNDPALFGRTDVRELRAIFDQVRRLRLELTTLSGLRVRLKAVNDNSDEIRIMATLDSLSTALKEIANSLRRRSQFPWQPSVMQLEEGVVILESNQTGSPETLVLRQQCAEHLRAVAGQVRAAGKLVDFSGRESGKRIWLPVVPDFSSPDLSRVRANALSLKDNLHLSSPAFRHAVRLAVAVPAAAVLGSWLGLPRSFWLTFAVLVILKPDYSSLLDRGLGRMIGTVIGATLAALLVGGLHPNLTVTVVLVALTAWLAYSTWYVSFAISFGFITALVLILLSITSTDTLSTALDRLLDFSLGGVIALAAYLVWPTSLVTGVNQAMESVYRELEHYLTVVFALVERKTVAPEEVVARSRAMRVAWVNAESAVGRAVAEPGQSESDAADGRGQLATTMRILRALHAMRIEAERGYTSEPASALDDLAQGCANALRSLHDGQPEGAIASVNKLRALYREAAVFLTRSKGPESLSIHLDELTNAINTATELSSASRAR